MENTEVSIPDYSAKIIAAHNKATELAASAKSFGENAIAYAAESGKWLTLQKRLIPHGKFIEWCDAKLPFTVRTVQKYMCLVKRMPELVENAKYIENGNTNHGSYFTEDEINKQLADSVQENLTFTTTECEKSPKTLRQAYIATGILPDPKEDGNATAKKEQTVAFVKHIDGFVLWYRKRTQYDPIENWNPQTRSHLIMNLRPIAEIYKQLIDLQDKAGVQVLDSQRAVIVDE